MNVEVLDACAVIAYLIREPGGDLVESLLGDPDRICCVHAINLCEFYYHVLRISGETVADQAIESMKAAGIEVRDDMDEVFWKVVGRLKRRGKISLADCFCLALAIRLGGRVVTADHGEFEPIVPLGLCPILFIR